MAYYIAAGDEWSYTVTDCPPRKRVFGDGPFDSEMDAHIEMADRMRQERARLNKAIRAADRKIASLY